MAARALRLSLLFCYVATQSSPSSSPGCAGAQEALVEGRYGRAEELARGCVARSTSANRPAHLDLLVQASYRNGNAATPAALAAAESAVEARRGRFPIDRLGLAASLHGLGLIYLDRGEFSRALPLHEEAHQLRTSWLGGDDPRLAHSLEIIGLTLIRLERLADAEQALDQALAIRDRRLPNDLADLSRTLELAAMVRRYQGEYPVALGLIDRALSARGAVPVHPEGASLLNTRGDIRFLMGDVRAATEDYREALELGETTLAPDHPAIARYLRKVALMESALGNLAAAREMRERALRIGDARVAACHPDRPAFLNDLALSVWFDGDYVSARRLYERALEQNARCLGAEHSLTTTIVHNLGLLAADMGDQAEAERLQERAVRGWSAGMGPGHPYVAVALDALADVKESLGRLDEARKMHERALDIRLRALGAAHPDVAWTMANLARVKAETGDIDAALKDVAGAVNIFEQAGVTDQPDRHTRLLVQRGDLLMRQARFADARRSFSEALAGRIQLLGEAHPLVAEARLRKASADFARGAGEEALAEALRAEAVGRDHLRFVIRYLPERQGLTYSDKRPRGLDLALSVSTRGRAADVSAVFESVIRSRGLVLDEIAERQQASRRLAAQPDPDQMALRSAQQRLANLAVRGPDALSASQYAAIFDQARRESEAAEEVLAARSASFRAERTRAQLGLDDVARGLPNRSALVSFVQYGRTATRWSGEGSKALFTSRAEPSYLAFVLRPDEPPVVVELGPATVVDEIVSRWRSDIATELLTPAAAGSAAAGATMPRSLVTGAKVRRAIWDKLQSHLAGASRVFVVPDGSLSLVPMAALPTEDGRYLIDSGPVLHYLSTERDLARLEATPEADRGLLAVGGPAFDDVAASEAHPELPDAAAPGVSESLLAGCGTLAAVRFQPLEGTVQEVNEIERAWSRGAGSTATQVLIGRDASEASLKRRAPRHRILHLATHGFFLDGSCFRRPAASATRGVGGLSGSVSAESPLRLSGLALAGANRRAGTRSDEEDGILTAEEVSALDLSGVEWAVLSACDTGVGEIRAGEGVFGLRRAFQVAGARTVIMSLWSVEDQATRAWMRALYEGRFQRQLSTADAVHQASLTVLRDRRARGQSTLPFFWAAFVAAGDWR